MMEYIYGLHNIIALLDTNADKIKQIYISYNKKQQYYRLINQLANLNIKTNFCDHITLEKLIKNNRHNGLVAQVLNLNYISNKNLKAHLNNHNNSNAIFLILDGVTDTNNLGAIIRNCECLGVQGLILPNNNTAPVNHTVARVSAGASYYLPIFIVNSLIDSIAIFKDYGYLIAATILNNNATPLSKFKTSKKIVWILGGEEKGISKKIQNEADALIKIDMSGKTQSLNVSVTAGLIIFDTLNKTKSL